MKTKLSIGLLGLSLVLAIGFSSCTQDTELKPAVKELRVIDARTWEQRQMEDLGNGDETSSSDESGNVQMVVSPSAANATVRIYNDVYDSGEVPSDEDAVLFRYLPPGFYTIDITPANTIYSPVRFENVEILVNTLTDLGEIRL